MTLCALSVPRSTFLVPGSSFVVPGSSFLVPGSQFVVRLPSVEARGLWREHEEDRAKVLKQRLPGLTRSVRSDRRT